MRSRSHVLSLLALGATLLATSGLHATIIASGPFVGDLTETWESFTPGTEDNNYAALPEGTLIMGGGATIKSLNHDIAIFGSIPDNGYGVGAYVKPSDGLQGMGTGSQHDSITIDFLNPIVAFGGYFAAYGSLISVSFSDGSLLSFNYGQQNTGVMAWHGWSSDVGISSVSWSGEFVAVDGLQAKFAAPTSVPDVTSTAGLFGLAMGGLFWMRRRVCV